MSTISISKEAQEDISELKSRIGNFHLGLIPEERFKAFRLTRGVYGQRQQGVQMLRIKLPYGKITPDQLRVVAEISDEYTNGNLHLTTRQNIQLHHIPLDDTPAIWNKLERVGVTLREACGNTVRNVTASPTAGIDPNEPFDVTPYADATFKYFLRNPVCQDMGRKIKIAFSSSDQDDAFTYIHDFGFIPKIKSGIRGFKVVVGGGLGAQTFFGQIAYEFLPEEKIIPFVEAGLRVFDRHGERERRHKARLKFLLDPKKGIGLDEFLRLIDEEYKSLPNQVYPISHEEETFHAFKRPHANFKIDDVDAFRNWKRTNVTEQKQKGYYAVKIKVPLGNISSTIARKIALIAEAYASTDIRITINQGLLFRYVSVESLPALYTALGELDLNKPGFDTLADVTACPGTDTCNLGVTNSTQLATELEKVIQTEYVHLIDESQIKIKISGCMNSCGQHMIANIGFHGSSIKNGDHVVPAMQVVIGGGIEPDHQGYIAEKVIKLPTKRIPDAVRILLDDFEANAEETEYFNQYFRSEGKKYFYELLKPLADLSSIQNNEYLDWGGAEEFTPEVGVGECAGVVLDLVSTIIGDAKEKIQYAREDFEKEKWANAIYHSYSAFVIGAKALLLSEDVQCNTHKAIIEDFEKHFESHPELPVATQFSKEVLRINRYAPNAAFARVYLTGAEDFINRILKIRRQSEEGANEKLVVKDYYKA
ncbi:sulfite reductase (ferredoxin) [Ekhidna lutea]|uniref:Sulfite reductase (Ferredoxin) n=1 Tax=Ekhidna lutea TaxID=447679 RepID=A0A239LK07_EKHLU|nr:nitrite/sulfite reductase [Ekhidna lutea]SNT29989.1 sulfite reductase (ferredoxin) [Ekhidna lutea]